MVKLKPLKTSIKICSSTFYYFYFFKGSLSKLLVGAWGEGYLSWWRRWLWEFGDGRWLIFPFFPLPILPQHTIKLRTWCMQCNDTKMEVLNGKMKVLFLHGNTSVFLNFIGFREDQKLVCVSAFNTGFLCM